MIQSHRLHLCPLPNSPQKSSAPPNATLGLGSRCESFGLCHCFRGCFGLTLSPSRTQLCFALSGTRHRRGQRVSRRTSPRLASPPPTPIPQSLLQRTTRAVEWTDTATPGAHPFSHRPSISAAPASPPPSIRCVSARRGRRGARAGAPRRGLTCRAPASRRAAAAGGGLRLRARQCGLPGLAPRRGGGAEGGPAEVGLAQGGNGGDAITKPVRPGAGRTAPPWTGEALHHAGPWEGAWPPTAAAPAARTANVEPARGSPEPAPKLRCPQSPSRARHCGATLIGAPRCPGPSQV